MVLELDETVELGSVALAGAGFRKVVTIVDGEVSIVDIAEFLLAVGVVDTEALTSADDGAMETVDGVFAEIESFLLDGLAAVMFLFDEGMCPSEHIGREVVEPMAVDFIVSDAGVFVHPHIAIGVPVVVQQDILESKHTCIERHA